MSKKVLNFKKTLKKLENKRKLFYNSRFHKYVVGYNIIDDDILVFSNIGNYQILKKSKSNINKLNKVILENKIEIQNRIDNFESTKKDRLLVIILNAGVVSFSGLFVVLSFFTGVIPLLFAACLTFSLSVITTSLNGFKYYLFAKEIQNLKTITNYKLEIEYKIPKIDLKVLKKN